MALPALSSLPPNFHLGAEGDFVILAAAEGMHAGVVVSGAGVIPGVVTGGVAPLLIPLGVGGEQTDGRTRPDAVARLPLLRQVTLYWPLRSPVRWDLTLS